jgi:hypothetical protein
MALAHVLCGIDDMSLLASSADVFSFIANSPWVSKLNQMRQSFGVAFPHGQPNVRIGFGADCANYHSCSSN